MKLPSFVKLPKYKRFEYQPRYYNPEEEERKQRREEIERAKNENEAESLSREQRAEKIRGSFSRSKARKKGVDIGQMAFVVIFAISAFLYLEFGNVALVFLTVFLGAYVWYRKRNF